MQRDFWPNSEPMFAETREGALILLGNCFWREGLEAAFGPERREKKGGW
jgi:hypothetical protein